MRFLPPLCAASRWVAVCALLLGSIASPAAEDPFAANVRPTDPLTPSEQQRTFKVPDGFEVQLVAAEPDINKPMNLAFDATGRLWVTTSREYPFPVKVGEPGRDRVMIFEDFGPDGRARKVTEFAGGLNIPIGVYPFRTTNAAGRLTWKAVVWSIPNIWLMEDSDGDGRADRKDPLYGPFDHTRDTHGNQASFRRGFDGWLYATHGFNNDSHVAGRDGNRVDLNSGNTYRIRLDGSRIEHHTWGQVNPYGLAWDPFGNLYSSDCHSEPIYLLLTGGYYPSFGKPHDGLGFAPNTMEQPRGSTAIDAVSYYADDLWPAEYQDSLFVGDVMTSRVYRDLAVVRGSGRVARPKPDFVIGEDSWFRPVDTTLGPDGALYIADFYNRIIGHYEVPLLHPGRDRERGRIWRVLYKAAPLRSPAIAWSLEGLVEELASPSLPRRMLAMNDLADRFGTGAEAALRNAVSTSVNSFQRVHALWLLRRFDRLRADELVAAAKAADPLVRVHAQRIVGEITTDAVRRGAAGGADDALRQATAIALAGLIDTDPGVRRLAAEALGNRPEPDMLRPLLDLLAKVDPADTHLHYTVRKSLRNLLRVDAFFGWLAGRDDLPEADVRALLDLAVAVNSEPAARFLLRHRKAYSGDTAFSRTALAHAARYAAPVEVDRLAEELGSKSDADIDFQVALFRAVQQGFAQRGMALTPAVRGWGAGLSAKVLESVALGLPTLAPAALAGRQTAAAQLAEATGAEALKPRLELIASDPTVDLVARAAAARAINDDPLQRAIADLVADTSQPAEWRKRVADTLFSGDSSGAEKLLEDVWRMAPQRFQIGLAGVTVANAGYAAELVQRMSDGRAPAGLLADRRLRERLAGVLDADARGTLDRLVAALPSEDATIRKLIEERRATFTPSEAMPGRGREIFAAACAACHQIEGQGGLVGPQLMGIGTRGIERLCEDVLAPNRNVDHAFWTTVLTMKDGEVQSGLFRREEGALLVLANAAGAEFTVPKADVKERRESSFSIMPTNFGDAMSAADFHHLLAYLLAQTGTK